MILRIFSCVMFFTLCGLVSSVCNENVIADEYLVLFVQEVFLFKWCVMENRQLMSSELVSHLVSHDNRVAMRLSTT